MKSIATQTIFSITESRITAFVVVVYARSYSHRTRASRRDVGCVCVASLSSIVLNRMGACNQGKKCFSSVLRQFTRRHSFCSYWRSPGEKKEQAYTEGTVILVRETLKPLKNRKHVVMCT